MQKIFKPIFAYRRRKLGDRNNMDDIKKYIIKHLLKDDIDEADLFFFGLKKSDNNYVLIGDGTDKSHFNFWFGFN